jgi:hypothetical protein
VRASISEHDAALHSSEQLEKRYRGDKAHRTNSKSYCEASPWRTHFMATVLCF